ncbi:hypothetical protein [Sphingobium yanoikuyae]|uniref:hypothetical protein n=1 Tax=Sphingobium yanoikuyae TaxID=13690 RepID=UPI00345E2161
MAIFRKNRDRLGGFSVGPAWLRLTWCRYGWSLWAFKRRIAWKPIDYTKANKESAHD